MRAISSERFAISCSSPASCPRGVRRRMTTRAARTRRFTLQSHQARRSASSTWARDLLRRRSLARRADQLVGANLLNDLDAALVEVFVLGNFVQLHVELGMRLFNARPVRTVADRFPQLEQSICVIARK